MNLHGFELVRSQDVRELNSSAKLYRHVSTGAELLSIENSDENKVFGISFRTPPSDSTGVAHILEHITLCGSRKYPLKDPFVELIKGSLKTFLNAFTYPDKTCYPVASQNLQDFYNLVDVYLDAVFFPRIARHHFEQEGWHYELEDASQTLTYKGVVFNEMKGAYSSPDNMLYKYTQQSLFPDTTYGVDSGGDPTAIPDLTYEYLKNFHDTLYHPSNSRIFFYGDDDSERRLAVVAAYLEQFQPITPASDVPLQSHFRAPKQVEKTYAASADEADTTKAIVSINWLVGEITDLETQMGLGILDYILNGTPAAPLRKALIESGLGENVVGGGLGDSLRQLTFSTGLKNIDPANAPTVEALVLDTLTKLANGSIEQEAVDAAVNTVEFALRENNTGSFPRGIALMLGALGGWLYGYDPIERIAFEQPLHALKARIAADAPKYFGGLIRSYLLDNPHRTTVLLKADPQLGERLAAAEREKLDAIQATLSDEQVQELIRHTAELKELQERPDPPEVRATIPSLTLGDLDRQVRTIPIEAVGDRAVRTLYHDIFTNGIVYLDLGVDLHTLPAEVLPYIPLFSRALTEMGTDTEDYVKLLQRIGRTTGGLRTARVLSKRRDSQQAAAYLFLRGKAMPAQVGDLLAIMRDVLTTVKFDNRKRFRQMALEEKARIESALVPSGHLYADLRLRARFGESEWANEQLGGISYLFFVRQLIQQIESDWPGVLTTLNQIQATLINRNLLLANVTTDQANWQTVAPQLDAALGNLPSAATEAANWPAGMKLPNEGLVIPAQVNYVAKGGNLSSIYPASGAVVVISNYLRTAYLWEQIRVRGGAYGGFSRFDRLSGVWSFLSYRDPNLLRSLDIYSGTGAFLRGLALSESELTRSIIGVISDLDQYELPDAKGYTSLVRYLIGETDATRQANRDQVLGTTLNDFHAIGAALDTLNEQAAISVIGGQAAIDQANSERAGLLEVIKVL